MLQKVKEKLAQVRDQAELNAVELIPDSRRTPDEIAQQRWEICQACEHLYKPTHTCKVCGCFMRVKTNMAHASCPKKKWLAIAERPKE